MRAAFAFLSILVAARFGCPASVSAAPVAQAPPAAVAFAQTHRALTTSDAGAQAAFDDGLTLLYAFNPESARGSFQRAAQSDPTLAIAWWGVAMTYGVNINTAYAAAAQRSGRAAVAHAQALETHASPPERALIAAAAERFSFTGANDAERSARAYRDAMFAAAAAFPQDDDIGALAAEAEMDVDPWSYFEENGTPAPGTLDVVARLEAVLARAPQHIQANHLLVHIYEESPQPERALAAARRLAALDFEPAAEHLAHMPAHTFMRVGEYDAAGEANARAVTLYGTFLASDPSGHANYFNHDCVFGTDAYMMAGEFAAAQRIAQSCDRSDPRLAARIDLRFTRYPALALLGESDDFIAGMLAAHERHDDDAAKHLAQLRKLQGNVPSIEADLLAARLLEARHDVGGSVAALEHAVVTQDGSGYSEPPSFWYPAREALGGTLYRAARYPEAERAFRGDLTVDVENPRALYGLAETLEREGHVAEANEMRARFEKAWTKADARLDINEF